MLNSEFEFQQATNFRKDASRLDLQSILNALRKNGLDVRANGTIKGRSGVDHSFAIVVERSAGYTEKPSGIDVAFASTGDGGLAQVMTLLAKSMDCQLENKIVIAVPRLGDKARIFAESYNMSVVEAKDTFSDIGRLEEILLGSRSVSSKENITKTKLESAKSIPPPNKRNSIDIMTDILKVVGTASGKSEIMACANLSYHQCQKYLPTLEKLGLMQKTLEDGVRVRYSITERGREYLSSVAGESGRIAEGERSIWSTRRKVIQASTSLESTTVQM